MWQNALNPFSLSGSLRFSQIRSIINHAFPRGKKNRHVSEKERTRILIISRMQQLKKKTSNRIISANVNVHACKSLSRIVEDRKRKE